MCEYYWSFDLEEEVWRNSGATVEDCIKEARSICEVDDYKLVYIGSLQKFGPILDGESIMECLENQAYDECGESSDGWLDEANSQSLGEVLTNALSEWLYKENLNPTFGIISDVCCYDLKTGVKVVEG